MTRPAVFPMHTKYCHADDAYLLVGVYHDGSTAMRVSSRTQGPLLTATVCLSSQGEKPAEGNVFIKDWSESEGVLKALQDNKIVGPVIREVPTGPYVTTYEVQLMKGAQPYVQVIC